MTNPDIEAAQIPDNASFPREIVENGITWKLLGAKYGTPQDIRMTMETYVQPVDDHPTPAQAQGESVTVEEMTRFLIFEHKGITWQSIAEQLLTKYTIIKRTE